MTPSSFPSLDAVVAITRDAGQIALRIRAKGALHATQKGPQDRVTEADTAVEAFLRHALGTLDPSVGFLGEEGGLTTSQTVSQTDSSTSSLWVCDPIDGTENFIRGIDHWSVSVALVQHGQPVLGVIVLPFNDTVYAARAGHGAHRNGQPLTVSAVTDPAQALIAIGISRRVDFSAGYLTLLDRLHAQGIEHRRFGSAAYSLCQVAEGTVEGYVEAHLNPWDAAAGTLIATEAGACALPLDMSNPAGGPVLVTTPGLKDCLSLG